MVRHLKALLLIACACGAPARGPVPQVVTVTVPYVALLPLDSNDSPTVLGRVRCDLVGHPYVLISTKLAPEPRAYVLLHERYHLAQIREYGSCPKFAARYAADSMFRLQVEADAYCGVLVTQRFVRAKPDPDYETIVAILQQRYEATFTRRAVVEVLPCF